MKCLYCGKNITSTELVESNWHKKCIKRFFGVSTIPKLEITNDKLVDLVDSSVNKGMTIPGVQKKISLHLSHEDTYRLTVVDYPTGFILKPQTNEYANLPEYENLAMRLADCVGIKTVPHALILLDSNYAYITKRIDRDINKTHCKKYAMEDFCQLANHLTTDKYKSSYEYCGKIINKYSSRPGIDVVEMFYRIIFSFVIGNSDMHLKNFSLIETSSGSREFALSDAYDMLPVNVILPEDTEQMALTVNGKRKNILYKDFIELANHCNIPEKVAVALIKKICSYKDKMLKEIDKSYLSEEQKESVLKLINNRINILRK